MSSALQRLDLDPGPYELTVWGLAMSGDSSPQQCEECGQALRQVEEARQWAIGDWLVDGKRHYGDGLYKRAAEITGLSESALQQFKSMTGRFQICLRKQGLSFQHHEEVQGIKRITTDDNGKLNQSDEADKDKIAELLSEAENAGGVLLTCVIRHANTKSSSTNTSGW